MLRTAKWKFKSGETCTRASHGLFATRARLQNLAPGIRKTPATQQSTIEAQGDGGSGGTGFDLWQAGRSRCWHRVEPLQLGVYRIAIHLAIYRDLVVIGTRCFYQCMCLDGVDKPGHAGSFVIPYGY